MRKLSFFSSVLSVSALLFALGSCTEGNIDNGDNTDGDQTPEEPVVYKVGDPYVVNGNTVGIVYEVDETGTHGKAYSLTVYNLSDKHFCIKEGEETPMVPGRPEFGTTISPIPIEEDAMPQSTTDGAANCQKMKNETDWQTHMPALKWVEDLAAAQGDFTAVDRHAPFAHLGQETLLDVFLSDDILEEHRRHSRKDGADLFECSENDRIAGRHSGFRFDECRIF